jgi:hypothetical protein
MNLTFLAELLKRVDSVHEQTVDTRTVVNRDTGQAAYIRA